MTNPISVPAAKLRRALTAVLPHAGDDDTLPPLTCVRFETAGAWLHLAATDRYSMAAARIHVPAGCLDHGVLLPGRDAKILRRMLKGAGGEVAALTIGGGELGVTVGTRASATWAAMDGKFVDWRPMLGKFLAAESTHLGDDCGFSAGMLARFTDPVPSGDSEALRMRVTAGSRNADGKPSPVVLFTRGDWFLGVVMPVRCSVAVADTAAWTSLAETAAGDLVTADAGASSL